MKRLFTRLVSLLFATFLVAGCTLQTRANNQNTYEQPSWHGRLAMQVDADPDSPVSKRQSFSAGFELMGAPDTGELRLFTPLGNTVAAIRWTYQSAVLEVRGDIRNYSNLEELTQDVLGASVPVPALFSWVQGQEMAAPGWQLDLSEFAQGKVIVERVSPLPLAHLRLILEP